MRQVTAPNSVQLDSSGIVITWVDGHRSVYSHRFLRLRCPCAQCVEEMTGRHLLDPAKVPSNVEAVDQMQVGNYALQFLWSDTHHTGIYTFDVLRGLCPCDACVKAREKGFERGAG